MTSRWRRALQELPDAGRWPVVGAVVLGVVGAVVGLVVGLVVHPPTAWAATVELGLPAAVLGGLLGLLGRGTWRRLRSGGGTSGRGRMGSPHE